VSTVGATYTKISEMFCRVAQLITSAAGSVPHSHMARELTGAAVRPALPAEEAPGNAVAAAMSTADTSPTCHRPRMTAPFRRGDSCSAVEQNRRGG
jgi:hypothetical protein